MAQLEPAWLARLERLKARKCSSPDPDVLAAVIRRIAEDLLDLAHLLRQR
jgi:hypothetical protein